MQKTLPQMHIFVISILDICTNAARVNYSETIISLICERRSCLLDMIASLHDSFHFWYIFWIYSGNSNISLPSFWHLIIVSWHSFRSVICSSKLAKLFGSFGFGCLSFSALKVSSQFRNILLVSSNRQITNEIFVKISTLAF